MAEVNQDRPAPAGRRVWPVRRRPAPPEDIAARDIAVREAADQRPPPLDPEPPPRFDIAALRLGALGLALVLALGIALVRVLGGGPPSVADLRAEAGVDGWPVLPIGVKADQPGVAYFDSANGVWSGFDIDIAYMIAEDLGFRRSDVQFYAMQSEDRARMQATDDRGGRVPVKMVIASYSINADREAKTGVTFSAPYLFTEQSVLTLAGHKPVAALDDFRGQDVCTLSASTSQAAPGRAQATVISKNTISECIRELRAKRVDAVTTDAAILAGYKAASPKEFAHWDLGLDDTEAWGVNVGENEALRQLVDLTLYRSLKDPRDNRWEIAYEKNLQSEVEANKGTPIAVAQQPDVPEPDVREQPWEDVVP